MEYPYIPYVYLVEYRLFSLISIICFKRKIRKYIQFFSLKFAFTLKTVDLWGGGVAYIYIYVYTYTICRDRVLKAYMYMGHLPS